MQDSGKQVEFALQTLHDLMILPTTKPFPDELKDNDMARECYEYLSTVKFIISCFSKGDFSHEIRLKGVLGGLLKHFQANMRHLNWQVQMVADGDFFQRVDFMGEFSTAFNSMVEQLDRTLRELRQREDELHSITDNLKKEIASRAKAEEALKKSHKRYQELALKDPLTGINNRRHFHELAMVELKKLQRKMEGVVALGMLDIDLFKNINDTYGHLVGDKCLVEVAAKISQMIRAVDIIARYGGEEFVCLLPGTSSRDGMVVAERICREIEAYVIKVDAAEFKITMSIGLTEVTAAQLDEEGDLEHLLARTLDNADSAMYQAKNRGRNCVVRFEGEDQ